MFHTLFGKGKLHQYEGAKATHFSKIITQRHLQIFQFCSLTFVVHETQSVEKTDNWLHRNQSTLGGDQPWQSVEEEAPNLSKCPHFQLDRSRPLCYFVKLSQSSWLDQFSASLSKQASFFTFSLIQGWLVEASPYQLRRRSTTKREKWFNPISSLVVRCPYKAPGDEHDLISGPVMFFHRDTQRQQNWERFSDLLIYDKHDWQIEKLKSWHCGLGKH